MAETQIRHVVRDTRPEKCETHGAYQAQLLELDPPISPRASWSLPQYLRGFWTRCPQCDANMQAEVDADEARIRNGQTQRQIQNAMRLRNAGIPARYSDSSLFNWSHPTDGHKRAWGWARDYASSLEEALASGRSGLLVGASGSGKTHLAIGILRHIIEKGGTGLYTTAIDMIGRIRATYHRDAHETEEQALRALTTCDLLVVDEIGKQQGTDHDAAQLFRILDRRYADLKPVILVTNLPPKQARDFLGEAVCDRLRENGGRVLTFDWLSHRSRKRKDTDA